MKNIYTALLFGGMWLFPLSTYAESPGDTKVCEEWASKAGSYMLFRQMNTPIYEAMENAMGNVTRGLLLSAYQQPVAETNEGKQQAIDNFKNQTYGDCISQME
ncbi:MULTISPECIES: hypothetical protein [unclassified Methylophaga]|jgi:hypothetical protein|uniref:hypothetical protein n=1 Tax=unclassified Methylophaga TaxID=2629249 RepID=UPI000C9579D2|nr:MULTISPECIES: hypothetical protein [unclassified Methylophaga]MAK65483.1 hypothetical protein [Methylophaga sp.]MAY16206.1 hypothetical protein [Methylophaga sp.]HCD06463.1 hypothetical protein [Methylophaga sp.]|tara:strand:+ start:4390 stop:4698 length:309 start_codon:yes stop_codon:yes gene_type:complete